MQVKTYIGSQSDKFNLKNVSVNLIPPASRGGRAFLSIDELETIRAKSPMVPASKHALETICGASCETGAW
jgi:hypothetical protein